jgi:hypothetical protein
VNDINQYLTPDYFIKVSPSFAPAFCRVFVKSLGVAASHEHRPLRQAATRCLHHHLHLLAAIDPDRLVFILRGACQGPDRGRMAVTVSPLGAALARIRYFPFVYHLVSGFSAEQLEGVPPSLWDLIGECGSDLSPILEVIGGAEKPVFVDAVARIAAFKPMAVQQSLRHFSIDFVSRVVKKLDAKSPLSLFEYMIDMSMVCLDLTHEHFGIGMLAAARMLRSRKELTDDEVGVFQRIQNFARNSLAHREMSLQAKFAAVHFLRGCSLRRWEPAEKLLLFVNLGNDIAPWRKLNLGLVFDVPAISLAAERIRHGLIEIAKVCPPEVYRAFVSRIITNFRFIRSTYEDFAFQLISHLMRPLPVHLNSAFWLLKLLNSLSIADLSEPRLRLDSDVIVTRYLRVSDEAVESELGKFIHRIRYWVDAPKLDFLCEASTGAFRYIRDMNPKLLDEILSYGMLSPTALRHCLEFLARTPRFHASVLSTIVELLQYEVQEFGISWFFAFRELGLPCDPNRREMAWISQRDLHALFVGISGDFCTSEFGLLMEATLDTIWTMYQSITY